MVIQAPIIQTKLNDVIRYDVVERMVYQASRFSAVGLIDLTLSNIQFEFDNPVIDGDKLILHWGYRGEGLAPLFTGSVKRAYSDERLHITALDFGRQLTEARITTTYNQEQAFAIINHLTKNMEFTDREISENKTIIDKLPLTDHTVHQALHFLNSRLNQNYCIYADQTGRLCYNQNEFKGTPVYIFDIREDIIELKPLSEGHFKLTVFGIDLFHSCIIAIIHANGEIRNYCVNQIRHSIGVANKASRSELWIWDITDLKDTSEVAG